ncbi:hypothetical protein EYR40_006145 [Pleurotus pulmonarius]|nr:hypothetical protein EYR36_010768 [Pleurotus pulmonarius]KAF4599056.1 hypothetical protein EYR40_006145 [Pleurotus pulmonarius]
MFPFDDLHIVEDDQVMSSRLGLESVPTKLVDDCYQNLIIDKKDDIMWLRAVVDEAKNEEGYYCEADEEARMRGYLARIFNYIASFERSTPRRQWNDSANEIDEIGPDGVPPTYPKLTLGSLAKPGGMGVPLSYSEALIQSGDYARLHLAGSPFRLFSVGLIINGNDFRVGAFDRAGVMVSSAANMWTDTRTLIRVIRRLSCNLSDTDLGCDPSACRLPLNSPWYASIRKIATSLRVASDSLDYPSYIVQSPERPLINGDPRHSRVQCEWLTIGPPTWTCLSLFGKGTSIWRVIPVVGDVIDVHAKVYTLKNEWRDSHCVSDSELYEIEGTASAADYHYGGDAVFPYAKSSPAISITNIRNPDYRVKRSNLLDIPSHRSIKPTLMLHRLILKTVGRPLWDADDWVQLLEGFRTALICHEGLWKQGLLHRDINPGNILLTEDGKEGFIADLELVRLRQTEYIRRKATNGGTETTAELVDHVVEDTQALSSRLGLDAISSMVVEDCYRELFIDKKGNIVRLQELVDQAVDEYNYMGNADARMYEHLVEIFNYIATFRRSLPQKQWDASETRTSEIGPDGVPCTYPNLRLGNRDSQPISSWRDLGAFAEAKPCASQGMLPGAPLRVSEALIRSGDYARIHLAGSPFRLFSVGLMITGHNFQVGIFDRAGVVVSSTTNMWENIRTLIRVIRRLSCDLSHIDLGCDPSVRHLPLDSPLFSPIREIAKSLGVPPDSLGYPSYIVQCRKRIVQNDALMDDTRCGADWETHQWLTIGPPTWASLSLVGPGTSIWRVTPVVDNAVDIHSKVYTLKNEWRDSHCISDSEIYEMGQLEDGCAGTTDFHYGGDVVLPHTKSSPAISIINIRNPDYHVNRGNLLDVVSHRSISSTPILHRLILKTVGRPLWDAVNYIELMKGFRAALLSHGRLWKQGILHRDINAGNIMLAIDPKAVEEGEEGYIMDLQLARLRHIKRTRNLATKDCDDTEKITTEILPRVLIPTTGNIQFMAIEKLKAYAGVPGTSGIVDEVYYDLESFIWVFAYAVMRRLVAQRQPDSISHVNEWFKASFCRASVDDMILNRASLTPLELPWNVCPEDVLLPEPIANLLALLQERVQYNQSVDKYLRLVEEGEDLHVFIRRLSHDFLITKSLDRTLASLLQSLGR